MTRLRSVRLLCLTLGLLASGRMAAHAATLNVPSSTYLTIQSAVTAAANGDTVLVAAGTYSGPGNRDIDFGGKSLTVTSSAGAASTIIDCGGTASSDGSGNHRGFYIHSGETAAVINGFTVKNGYTIYTSNDPNGGLGGIAILDSNAEVRNCVISGNTAKTGYDSNGFSYNGAGGGCYNSNGTITLMGCTVSGNTADSSGGIENDDFNNNNSIMLTKCLVSDNRSNTGLGGGVTDFIVRNNGSITLTDCTISGNTTPGNGGGCDNETGKGSGTISLIGCTISGNTAAYSGGGVYNKNVNDIATITLTNCTVSNNTSTDGGGIYNQNEDSSSANSQSPTYAQIELTGCSIFGNTSVNGNGGGVYNSNFNSTGLLTLINCTILNNKANDSTARNGAGGGICNWNTDNGKITITACTVSGNNSPETGFGGSYSINGGSGIITFLNDIFFGDIGSEFSTSGSGSTINYSDIQDGYAGTGNINADPLFVNAAGGDVHLKSGTPCIGAGTASGAPATDKDGNIRGNPPTIGAYEGTKTIHILWDNANTASIWNYSPTAGTYTQNSYGPYAGWSAKAIADGATDGLTRVLWDNTNGAASIWSLNNTTGVFSQFSFGPSPGWTAKAFSVGPDNITHVLWANANGTASFYNYSTTGAFTQHTFGPYAGWAAVSIADGTDGKLRVLWDKTDGMASIWSLDNTAGTFTQHTFGPFAGYIAKSVSVGADGTTHVLWNNISTGQSSIWNYSTASGTYTYQNYGPFGGYRAAAITDGVDGRMGVIWNTAGGPTSLWSLDNSTGTYTYHNFGPYTGWAAAAISAGN